MSVLSELTAQSEAEQEAALDGYGELVRDLARDRELDLATVNAVISKVDRTAEQLSRDVGRPKRRLKNIGIMHDAEAARRERVDVQAQIDVAHDELEQAKRLHHEKVMPLSRQLDGIREREMAGFNAKTELEKSYPNPLVADDLRFVRNQLNSTASQWNESRQKVQRIRELIAAEKSKPRPGASRQWLKVGDGRGGDPATLEKLQKRLDSAQAEASRIENLRDELFSEERQLMARLLKE